MTQHQTEQSKWIRRLDRDFESGNCESLIPDEFATEISLHSISPRSFVGCAKVGRERQCLVIGRRLRCARPWLLSSRLDAMYPALESGHGEV